MLPENFLLNSLRSQLPFIAHKKTLQLLQFLLDNILGWIRVLAINDIWKSVMAELAIFTKIPIAPNCLL